MMHDAALASTLAPPLYNFHCIHFLLLHTVLPMQV